MTYGREINLMLKKNTELSNQEKLEKLKQFSVGDMLTLLRNFEESPYEYEPEVIKGLYGCLYDKGIMCV